MNHSRKFAVVVAAAAVAWGAGYATQAQELIEPPGSVPVELLLPAVQDPETGQVQVQIPSDKSKPSAVISGSGGSQGLLLPAVQWRDECPASEATGFPDVCK